MIFLCTNIWNQTYSKREVWIKNCFSNAGTAVARYQWEHQWFDSSSSQTSKHVKHVQITCSVNVCAHGWNMLRSLLEYMNTEKSEGWLHCSPAYSQGEQVSCSQQPCWTLLCSSGTVIVLNRSYAVNTSLTVGLHSPESKHEYTVEHRDPVARS